MLLSMSGLTQHTRWYYNQLAEHFSKKPHYFLDIFFSGGARMVTHHDKVNMHNAFTSLKAQEIHDGEKYLCSYFLLLLTSIFISEGCVMLLLDIKATYQDEYNALDEEEQDKLIQEFKENVDTTKAIWHPSPHCHIQDVSNTLHNVRLLVSSMFSLQVGHTVLTCHHHSLMGSSCIVVLRDSFAL